MGRLSCLFGFSKKNKNISSKEMGNDMHPALNNCRLDDSGKMNETSRKIKFEMDSVGSSQFHGFTSINSSLSGLEPSCLAKQHYPEFCRHEKLAASGLSSCSKSGSLSAKQSGDLVINLAAEPADIENSKELDLEFCRRSLDNDTRPSTVQASELIYPQEPEDVLYFKKAANPDIFSFHSVENDRGYECVADFVSAQEFEDVLYYKKEADPDIFSLSHPLFDKCYESMQDSISAAFSESPIAFQEHKEGEKVLSDDEMLTGHTSDPGVYHINTFSVRDSPLSDCNFLSLYPDTKIDFSSVQDKLKGESSNRILKQFRNVVKLVRDESFETIFKLNHSSAQSECEFQNVDKVFMKASSRYMPFSKNKSWWRTFLLFHRNIHKETSLVRASTLLIDQKIDEKLSSPITGYTSDICDDGGGHIPDFATRSPVDAAHAIVFREQPKASIVEGCNGFAGKEYNLNEHLIDLPGEETSNGQEVLWPSKNWIISSVEDNTLKRVQDWVSNLELAVHHRDGACEDQPSNSDPDGILGIEPQRDQAGANSASLNYKENGAMVADIGVLVPAIRFLNAFSTTANISGFGLRCIPPMGTFISLKILNLSANYIARITPGSLPRSLHALDLSRNKIAVVEGLRDLTRLRVLNLSYNRISRIGHGLANCTLIKELYLAGNKISDVEGLHRLLKLTVLDLSFNKLTTSKSIGQLAANYNSLLALNLLGNPVHVNLGDEQLRKLVISLVPHLTYLNKQPIKAVSAREVVVDSVARAALGSSQRASKSCGNRRSRKAVGTESNLTYKGSKPPSHHAKGLDKRDGKSRGLGDYELEKVRHYHTRHQRLDKGTTKEHRQLSRISPSKISPLSTQDQLKQRMFMGLRQEGMSRSRSEGTLWAQGD